MSRSAILPALAIVLILSGCDREADPAPQESAVQTDTGKEARPGEIDRSHAGDLMPAANMVDPDGAVLNLGALQGRPVLMNLWATWCAPCVKEMPQLDRLHKILAPDGIAVLTISEDRAGAALVEKFYRINELGNLDILIDRNGKVLRGSKVRGLPTTLLIDAKGREIGRVQGISEWDSGDVVAFLRRCLKP